MKIRDLIKKPLRDRKLPMWNESEYPVATLHREMNRLFDQFMSDFRPRFFDDSILSDFPKVDIKDKKKEIIVEAELPGMNEKDIHVQVEDDVLIIHGERQQEKEEENGNLYRAERFYGYFHRAIPLPDEVDERNAKAVFRKGVLKIKLPKKPVSERKAKLIEIE